jgi:RNA-binding protein PNO1
LALTKISIQIAFFMAPIVSAQSTASTSTSSPRKKIRRGLSASAKAAKQTKIRDFQDSTIPDAGDEDDEILIDPAVAAAEVIEAPPGDVLVPADSDIVIEDATPSFAPLPASAQITSKKSEIRRVPMPPHRMTPLKKEWVNIFTPLTEILGLQVRMNVQKRSVEIRVSTTFP